MSKNQGQGPVVRLTGDRKAPLRVACVETDATGEAGAVSISTPAGGGWLVIGAQTWTSKDLKA